MDILRGIIDQCILTWRLLRDPRVPLWSKVIPFLGLVYVVSPLDFIPDVIIVLGQLDDLGIIIGAMRLFEKAVPEYIAAEHRERIARRHEPLKTIEMPPEHPTKEKRKR